MTSTAPQPLCVVLWITHQRVPEWSLTQAQVARFRAALPHAEVVDCRSETEFRAALAKADVALTWRFEQAWFADAPRLRFLGTPAAGHEYLNVTPPADVLMRFGEFHGAIMGETVLALLLGFARRVLPNSASMHEPLSEYWPRDRFSGHACRLHGAHIVILGFGNIGRWVARLAKPFGTRLTGIRRSAGPTPDFFDAGDRVLGLDDLDAVLPTADHVVVALPATPETDRILDARRLALLPPSAFLVNVGRGNVLDETALVEALRAHRIAAAALDVYETEPLPLESPLRDAPNCYLYPHASAVSPDYLDLYLDEVAPLLRNVAESTGRSGFPRSPYLS